MRVGMRIGPFYASSRVKVGCGPGCLITFAAVAFAAGVTIGLVSGVRHPGNLIRGLLVTAALVGALVWLCVYLGRRGTRTPAVDPDGDPILPYSEDH